MKDSTRWLMIMAARLEAGKAWKRATRYNWRYQSVKPFDYLVDPRNSHGFGLLSWLFLRSRKRSLLLRIANELQHLLHQEGLRSRAGGYLPLRVRSSFTGKGWHVHSY